jgi:glycerate 2-kinase
MAAAAATCAGAPIRAGLVVGADLGRSWVEQIPPRFEAVVGGHPLPTSASEEGGRRALALADSVRTGETLLVLLSGGASALLAVPADGVTLDDKRRTTNQLLRAGADIYALNTVRKHLSAIKGGRLAARTSGLCRTLVISDVVGDDLSVIASGPTVGDASTFTDALDVLHRFGGVAAFPAAVVERLRQGAAGTIDDTPAPDDPRLARTTTTIIGSRQDAMRGGADEATRRGYRVIRIDEAVTGEAREMASAHLQAAIARAGGGPRPVCIISSGETTVQVTGSGKGGRNQEFALAAAPLLSTLDAPAILASAGTDGVDGPTDAAGAIADRSTLTRASAAGLSPDRFLSDNNAYAFFHALDDLIHTGPTGTNVGDLQVILLA